MLPVASCCYLRIIILVLTIDMQICITICCLCRHMRRPTKIEVNEFLVW